MTSKLKMLLVAFLSAGNLFLIGPVALAASSNPLDQACDTNSQTKDSPLCKQAQTQDKKDPIAGPNGIINKAANIIALVTIIGAVIMILIGGFFYVTSAGNAENAKKAKDRIVAALIGLIVVALAWAIVRLVTDRILQ